MTFIEHLKKYLTDEQIEQLINSLKEEDKHCLLLNTDKFSEEKLLEIYPHLVKHPIVSNCYLYDKNEYPLGKSLLYELGAFYLQEPAAAVVSHLLPVKENQLILDLCAAPGGKSIGVSLKLKDTGLIISNDLSYPRAKIIKENVERMGLGNLFIISNDFSSIHHKYKNTFDAIILDAPCSGSGMFRKNDLMEEDWSINKVNKFASIQKELISFSYSMLKEGGYLIYSTCSFSYEEDEEVISYLLDNTDAEIIPFEDNPLFYKDKSNLGIHLFPYLFPGEGHYICLIKKPGILKETNYEFKKGSKLIDGKLIKQYGDISYLINRDFISKDFNIIRQGVKYGEILKDDVKYDIHFARNTKSFSSTLEISKEDTIKYIKGESLNIIYPKGYVLLTYLGINIDIAKSDGRIIKNRYPKYLRKNISF